ncbi:MAG: molybdenum cofactor guanylyltransferase [Gemmatimonadota bacterium]
MPARADEGGITTGNLLGVILAGGGSRRFGREKALFPLAGRPMAAWALEALRQCTPDQVVITTEPRIAETLKIRSRPDRIPGAGPLGGLHAALSWAREEGRDGVFLLACDLPLVKGDLIHRILGRWPSGAPAAVPGSPGPLGFEPLCAGYGTDVLEAAETLLQEGRRAMESLLEVLEVAPIPIEELGKADDLAVAFTNVNTEDVAEEVETSMDGKTR